MCLFISDIMAERRETNCFKLVFRFTIVYGGSPPTHASREAPLLKASGGLFIFLLPGIHIHVKINATDQTQGKKFSLGCARTAYGLMTSAGCRSIGFFLSVKLCFVKDDHVMTGGSVHA
jgi:hypothetical protein